MSSANLPGIRALSGTSASRSPTKTIRKRRAIGLFFASGRRLNDAALLLLVLPRDPEISGEVFFLTPRKIGGAVVRNCVRRRMREIFRRWIHRPGDRWVYGWMAKRAAASLDFWQLKEKMVRLAARAREM
ncbi:ribonuclease P protein component [Methylacidimicrobium cyclopophantes]|uniref:ribonuclease P protein component n=1 Tax=Methylacidimicrobium cyclopophantes TaxID=1041766 RepID=UPI0015B5191D|nr:ribonuclease P protein component [Methylacidimicrobium cyclopophantes]